MGRTVLLHHQLPDGSSHFDWLTERPGSDRLLSFRVRDRIDDPRCGWFEAEAMPDHRRAYLEYEGEVSAGRGSVRRAAAGSAERVSVSSDSVLVVVDFGRGPRQAVGVRLADPGLAELAADVPVRWAFTVTPLERAEEVR